MKLKSHSGLKKRIKFSARGKVFMRKPGKKHLLINKSKRQKDAFAAGKPVHHSDAERIARLLPYS